MLGNRLLDRVVPRKIPRELLGAAVTIPRIARECFRDHRVEPSGHFFAHTRRRRRRLGEALCKTVTAGERRLAGEHLVENAAETVNVAASVDLAIAEQL